MLPNFFQTATNETTLGSSITDHISAGQIAAYSGIFLLCLIPVGAMAFGGYYLFNRRKRAHTNQLPITTEQRDYGSNKPSPENSSVNLAVTIKVSPDHGNDTIYTGSPMSSEGHDFADQDNIALLADHEPPEQDEMALLPDNAV